MGQRFQLEIFEAASFGEDQVALSAGDFEEQKLASFEEGYGAGWDDAVAAQDGETARVRADLAQNLQDLSFTYAEAHRNMMTALQPLLSDMVTKVLPDIAQASLGPIIVGLIMPVASDLTAVSVELAVSPDTRPIVAPMLVGVAGLRVKLVDDPLLTAGQAYLRFADRETRIDLDAVVAAISRAVTAFFQMETEKERAVG